MDTYDQLKLDLYESGLAFDESCNIIEFMESCSDEKIAPVIESVLYFLESGIEDDVFLEMKTREEYHKKRFEKRYNYQKDKNDPDSGTITVDGETYKVKKRNPLTGDDKNLYADPTNGDLIIGKNLYKLKNHKRENAVLQHEIGHLKLMAQSKKNEHLDRSMLNKNVIKHVTDGSVHEGERELITNGLPKEDRKELLKELELDRRRHAHEAMRAKRSVKEDKEKTAARERFLTQMKKHEGSTGHLNRNEFEADQYSANRAGSAQLLRGVRELGKIGKKQYAKQVAVSRNAYRKALDDNSYITKKQKDAYIKMHANSMNNATARFHKEIQTDAAGRRKALRDKSVSRKDRAVY